MQAFSVSNAFQVISEYKLDGEFWIVVSCEDYKQYNSLPAGLEYKGLVLGKAGWNSDTGLCHYSTSWALARAVRF